MLFQSQVVRQYYNEKKTLCKKNIDFGPFKEAMVEMKDERHIFLSENILDKGIFQISKCLDSGLFTVQELVVFFVKRIEKLNTSLNAMTQLNPDALEIAKWIDQKRKYERTHPILSGIPLLLKDNIATCDRMNTTAGAKIMENERSLKDADIVSQIRKRDAIILGKTNLSEWSFYMSSTGVYGYSSLGGQTHNPYGTFDVGGSSSGSAVSVSANFAVAALGTETYGSIIYPAGQNCVVGLKPTYGLLGIDGIIPISKSLDVVGILAKSSEDAEILLKQLITKEYLTCNLEHWRIGVISNKTVLDQFRSEDLQILERCIEDMKSLRFSIDYIQLNEKAFDVELEKILQYEFSVGINDFLNEYYDSKITLLDIIEFNLQDPSDRMPYGQDLLEQAMHTKITELENNIRVKRAQQYSRKALDEVLVKYDALLTVSDYLTHTYACAGYPALTIPGGYRSTGEPVGITLVASPKHEDKLLKIGKQFESVFHYRRHPT